MLFSKSLLSQRVQLPKDNQELQSKLIAKVFEIEHGAKVRTLPTDLVLGKVTSVEKHPNADTLFVCQVNCAQHGTYQICTGGENVATGQYVPVALPGCYLSSIDTTIGSRKMRGLDSNGMICSKGELNINEDEDKHRIRNMGEDLPLSDDLIGRSLCDLFPSRENIVFEVESVAITNRADLRGHFGLAVECRTVFSDSDYQLSSNTLATIIQATHQFVPNQLEILPKHEKKPIIQTKKVNYYSLTSVQNIINSRSEFTGRMILTDLGHTPRQNRVDYSNWFMEMYGHPIHVFDADTVQGDIIIKEAKDGENFTDLTGKQHTLATGDIIICDNRNILALGGIIGGASSAFSDTTKNIYIEIAHFDPIQIRKTATRLGLRTDASMRFEKGINPLRSMYCTQQQANIIRENHEQHHTGEYNGSTYTTNTDDQALFETKKLTIDLEKTALYLQGSVISETVQAIPDVLAGLGYNITNKHNDSVEVTIPLRRSDISMIQDVYEDLARHLGLENIPELPLSFTPQKKQNSISGFIHDVGKLLISSLKMDQVETYPRYSKERIDTLGHDISHYFELQNPTDSATPYMAHTLLPGLLSIAQKNYRQVAPIKIFEVGKTFINTGKGGSKETKVLSALALHKKGDTRQDDNYLQIKKILALLSQVFQIQEFEYKPSSKTYYHPNKQATISTTTGAGATIVGEIGEVHPHILEEVGIGSEYQVSFLEIEIATLYKYLHTAETKPYLSLQDQIITRDLSFEIPTQELFDKTIDVLSHHDKIATYHIFDIYQKDDKKSISATISILGDGAMTTEQINNIMNEIIHAVEKTGATLKGQKNR